MALIEGHSPVIKLRATHADYPPEMVERSVNEIVSANPLFFLSTVRDGKPYGCVMVFAYDQDLCMLFFSNPKTEHVFNIAKNPQVAGEIADTHQTWESPRRGMQFMGTARMVEPHEAAHVVDLYMARFPGFERHKIESTGEAEPVKVRPFIVRPSYLKIFDEKIFGRETWVEVDLPPQCDEFPGKRAVA